MNTPTMQRPRARVIGGVCAGFAAHTGLSVSVVRLCAVVLAAAGGSGLLLYGWLWATVPEHHPGARPERVATVLQRPAEAGSGGATEDARTTAPAFTHFSEILVGVALLVIGGALVAARAGAAVPLQVVIPIVVACVGAGLAWQQFSELRAGRADAESRPMVRILGAITLVAMGILLFFVTATSPNVWTVITAAFAVLLGVALVVAPWVIRLSRDLADERAARAREAERTVIATHLHDSVLQSLALIQQKSGAQSDIARIARAQERDLRSWLFGDGDTRVDDLPNQLRTVAAELEDNFPVTFDVVAVGMAPISIDDAIAGAAREAMLNAARHAGGTVSVFVEFSAQAVEVSVIDRGPGFDLAAVSTDRHGVRDSIVGRMTRAGGSAELSAGPGGTGTRVVLRLPTQREPVAEPVESVKE